MTAKYKCVNREGLFVNNSFCICLKVNNIPLEPNHPEVIKIITGFGNFDK